MSVKLIMRWDILPGQDQEFFEFVVREWGPGLTRLGIEPTGSWFTQYSRDDDAPRMMTEGIADDLKTMRRVLASPEWEELHDKLMEHVVNYSQKVVRTSGEFQL